MIVDKNKFSRTWRVVKSVTLAVKLEKSRLAVHHRRLETEVGQPASEIIRLLKLYPNRFEMYCKDLGREPFCTREEISFFDKTTKVAFSIKRAEMYNTDTYFSRSTWINNSHESEKHPWLTERECDALCTTVKDIIKLRESEKVRKELERQEKLLEEGRQKMMAVYGLTEED